MSKCNLYVYIYIHIQYVYMDTPLHVHRYTQSITIKNHPESWRKKQKKTTKSISLHPSPKILVFQSSQPPFPDRVFWMTLERS